MSLGSRINEIRKERGMSIDDLCALSGVPKGTVSKITAGITTSPTLDTVKAIARALNCRLDDFDDIETKKAPSVSERAMMVARAFDGLDDHGRRLVELVVKDQQTRIETTAAEVSVLPDNVIPIQRSQLPASAGTGVYLGPEDMEIIQVVENDLTRRASFCVPVSGDSMEPAFHDGDILLVEGCEDIPVGKIGVFTVDGDGYVKERGEGELISLNPAYPPVPMVEDVTWCNGLVIGVLDPEWIVEK